MAIGILGKKVGMTNVFQEDGTVIPVTVIEAGPCWVLALKKPERDGYSAVQLGFGDKKPSRVNKSELGHLKETGASPKRFIKELKISSEDKYSPGQVLKADIFNEGDTVDVIGISIGKGFQGGMKRWNWKGGPKSHGSTSHRRVGSIGASSFPSRVFKGHHMPGRMGGEQKTSQNLKVVKADPENNLLLVSGPVPGHKGSFLIVKNAKKKPDVLFNPEGKKQEIKEEKKPEAKEAKKQEVKQETKESNQ